MSNNNTPTGALGELFVDAAREIIERSRIKAQIEKIHRVIEADKSRLRNAYAEIGKMHCEGTLGENKAKAESLRKTIAHLQERLAKAKIRLEQLQQAHSVDECTVAFRQELNSKISRAKDVSVAAAKDLGAKARSVADDLPETLDSIKEKANIAADKAKAVVSEAASRATAVVADLGKKRGSSSDEEEFAEVADTEDASAETAEADISTILESIDDTLREVDEIEYATSEENTPADGESPESFDF